jgi:HEAT repeat protein
MPSSVNRLFNIRPNEWSRVLLLFFMAFIAVTGITWGKLTVAPQFWEVVGVHNLGYSFILEGLLTLLLVALYTPFSDRLPKDRLLIIICVLSATIVLLALALVNFGQARLGYFLLYPLSTVIPAIFNLQWWTYVASLYDARAAKRVVPVLASNARLAGAFAGFSIATQATFLGSSNTVIVLWALSLVVTAVLAWLTPYILRTSHQTAVSSPTTPSISYAESVREGYQYVTTSPYLRWLAIATLFVMLLLTLFKFQSSAIINAAFTVDSPLSTRFANPTSFLGWLEGWANLLMLPVQVFLLSRIIGKIGLSKTNMMFPTWTTAVAIGLLAVSFLPASLMAGLIIMGSLAHLSANVLNTTFRNPIDYLLFNAVPLRIRGRARTFVTGILTPFALVIAGFVVLSPLANEAILPLFLLLVALFYLATAVRVSRQYTNALVSMLEQEDYSFLLGQEAADLTVTDPAALEKLRGQLAQSQSDEFTLFMATLISDVGGSNAVPILAELARQSDAHIRAATLDILAATEIRGTAVRDLFAEFLHDDNPQVRRSALAGLERVDGRNDHHYLGIAATRLADPDVEVRTQALPALLRYGDLAQREQALKAVQEMLASPVNQERAHALRALGQTADQSYASDIAAMLADPSDRVRLEAALILEGFSGEKLHKAVADNVTLTITPLLHDPVERTREAALVTVARLGDHNSYGRLAESLTDPSLQIRATAVHVLTGLGKKVIPTVLPLLDSPEAQLRKMATVILGRINRREYGPLVTAQVQASLLQIAENMGYLEALQPLQTYTSVGILQSAFRETNEQLVNEIFFILTAVQDPESIAVIRESLESDIERVRANAQEALESLTSPQTAELIAPILNPETPISEFLQISRETWDLQFPTTLEAVEKLTTDYAIDPWPRSIAVFALGEIGQAIVQPQVTAQPATPSPERAATASERRRPRRSTADLLDALAEDVSEPAKPANPPEDGLSEQRQARRDRAARASNLLDTLSEDEEKPAPAAPPPSIMETIYYPPPAVAKTFPITRVLALLSRANQAPEEPVRLAAQRASDLIAGKQWQQRPKEKAMLSTIERIIFLKEVLFFREMTVDQLKVLATVCEEAAYAEDQPIYKEGDAGGVLYVVVRGRVGIERELRRGTVARLATIEAYSYFGEMNLFDASVRTDTAVALQDTLTLNLRREPLIALARQYPDLSLELINVLSQRLRETTDQVARLTKSHPRALHKVFDQLE